METRLDKSYYSQRIFINDLVDSNQVMQSMWQTGVANATVEFCWGSSTSDYTQKWLSGNIKYFVSY